MPERKGQYTVMLSSRPTVLGYAAVVGKKEGEGLWDVFSTPCSTTRLWVRKPGRRRKAPFKKKRLPCAQQSGLFAVPGQFPVCRRSAQSEYRLHLRPPGDERPPARTVRRLLHYGADLALAAIFVDSGAADVCSAVTSSHFCTAERQFRYPLEYGGQRPPTSQWTATAAGSAVVGMGGNGPHIESVCIGRVTDLGVTDMNNMGAAMAPAAADTLYNYFQDTATKPDDYDLILTGDLSSVGSDLLRKLLEKKGYKLGDEYNDCGLLMYDRDKQDVHAGGSGCGCSAAVLCSYILGKIERGELSSVLFVGTGALMSPTSSQQGESIPGIAIWCIWSNSPRK